eukprot:scaffold272675_cov31-Tisochrysis_lutea.AAC.6
MGQEGILPLPLACLRHAIRHAKRMGGSSPSARERWREGRGSCPKYKLSAGPLNQTYVCQTTTIMTHRDLPLAMIYTGVAYRSTPLSSRAYPRISSR